MALNRIGKVPALLLLALAVPACGTGSGSGTLNPAVSPAVPERVKALAGNRSVTITWDSAATGATFVVKRSLTSGGPYFPVSAPSGFADATTYVDSGLSNATEYFYVVAATNALGSSADSPESAATPGFQPTAISTHSSSHLNLAILPDHSVWSWGDNLHGGLGNGISNSVSDHPVQVLGLRNATAVSVGQYHALALTNDGQVWSWGDNASGNLGLGTVSPTPATIPGVIPDFKDVVALSASMGFSLALKNNGTVWAWGDNTYGQLGLGTVGGPPVSVPTLIPNFPKVKALATGGLSCVALKEDGTIWTWGSNIYGQLGNGSSGLTPTPVPTKIPNLSGMVAIAAGYGHSMALRVDGLVWSWGFNSSGQQGNGASSSTPVTTPVQISSLKEVTGISAGDAHSLALLEDGTVLSWGSNNDGQQGNGSATPFTPVTTPTKIDALSKMTTVSAGASYTLGLDSDGTLFAWGTNDFGCIGNGTGLVQPTSAPILNITDVTKIAAGESHVLALRTDGKLLAWGDNQAGDLGAGKTVGVSIANPSPVNVLSGVSAVAGGSWFSVALKSDGTVWSWGYNTNSQLGLGSPSPTPTVNPTQITTLSGITAISVGHDHSLALKSDGTVWTWGLNSLGLGNGSTQSATPAQVSGLSGAPVLTGVVAIAAGNSHSLALLNTGALVAWGSNGSGELGIGAPSISSPTPVPVLNLSGVTAMGAGAGTSFAILSDGTLWSWGGNNSGELGLGGLPGGPGVATPTLTLAPSGMTAVQAGASFAVALRNDGTVWSWGSNISSQLGLGDGGNFVTTPTRIPDLAGVQAIAARSAFCIALMPDKTLRSWGYNDFQQLGRPFNPFILLPVAITQ